MGHRVLPEALLPLDRVVDDAATGGGDATVLLSPETEKEEWREIGERLQSATPGMHWVAEVADEAGAWVAEARYALTDGRWEMESMEGIA